MISVDPTRCRICYRCVRSCPVKAVRVHADQVQVVEERCIGCAACVQACPQGATQVQSDVPRVKDALRRGQRVVASLDPSLPAYFAVESFDQMRQALQHLGFADASEAALGAAMVAVDHARLVREAGTRKPVITSSCPAVVSLIEKYHPDLISNLAPVVSPMVAHARWLRLCMGTDLFIVFIGPCVAKKQEIADRAVAGAVDVVLTFSELQEWFEQDGIRIPPPTSAVAPNPDWSSARLSPLEGGLARSAGLLVDSLSDRVVTASGVESCLQFLQGLGDNELDVDLAEMMLCSGGCIAGPAMRPTDNPFANRHRVMVYARRCPSLVMPPRAEWPVLHRTYSDKRLVDPPVTAEQIREVLRRMDKYTPEDELNCGACGYPTCRDKAVATVRGMAEVSMCIPHMRRRAESLANVVLDLTPNLVVVVDSNLLVVSMSPSAERAFGCSLASVRHRPLSDILSPVDDFRRALEGKSPVTRSKVYYGPNLVVEQAVMPALAENTVVAIMRDITIEEKRREELSQLAHETIARSQEVIDRQMRVAHEIASLLGETTAESKIQLGRLIELVEGLEEFEVS